MRGKRIIPKIEQGEYTVKSCGVCDIDELIGTHPDLCSAHYSAPGIEYDYGYDYIKLVDSEDILGYYIGVDRFYPKGDSYSKEYILYEYALFVDDGMDEAAELLTSHLCQLASAAGCERVILNKNGGNKLFLKHLAFCGFIESGENFLLPVKGTILSDFDRMVIPTKDDALGYSELFFLREQGFILDSEKCLFEMDGECISVDRRSGACKFSNGFSLVGGDFLPFSGERAMGIIDICLQLMGCGFKKNIRIHINAEEKDETTPDVFVDGIGIFILEKGVSYAQERELRMKLKREGVLKKYGFYNFFFNFEVGGRYHNLGFADL